MTKTLELPTRRPTPLNKFRNQNDGYDKIVSDATALNCEDKSLTQQHMAAECDINYIVKRHAQTGVYPGNTQPPRYGDFTDVVDYQEACNIVIAAENMFMSLDADLRARFLNDPQRYIDFVLNPDNKAEALKLGLLTAKEEETPPQPPHSGGGGSLAPNPLSGYSKATLLAAIDDLEKKPKCSPKEPAQ